MNRHKNREKAVICIYQGLLVERDTEELINDSFTPEEQKEDAYMMRIIHRVFDNRERYTALIRPLLEDWSFERLGYIEQAILLCGCAEADEGETALPVIINEAVEIAKTYGDDSYRLINGVLDKL
ncbi:MAG: transcription antitermination factor NusB [Solobacterium sp.]|nr:transcription antitermination factor NusB [Solobacterium sp.]